MLFQLSETATGHIYNRNSSHIQSEPYFTKMIPTSAGLLYYDCFQQDNGNIKVISEPCDKGATCHEFEEQTFES